MERGLSDNGACPLAHEQTKMIAMRRASYFVMLMLLGPPVAQASDDALVVEANRRNDELVHQGFNLTYRMSVKPQGARLEMWVPTLGDEYVVSLWFAATEGEITTRLRDPSGEVLAAATGASSEQRLVRKLTPGKYVIEASGRGWGTVGIKGRVIVGCQTDAARVSEHAAQPSKGFFWPYLLVAAKAPAPTTLLVVPNNTGAASEDVGLVRAEATCDLRGALALADRLGTPVLMPLFPRPALPGAEEDLYLQSLTRAALTSATPKLARVDLQLLAMIDDARALLGPQVRPRVLITGFSASASFSNRFTLLHPARVLAAAVGSPGGWPTAPGDDATLTYPVGVADLRVLTGSPIDRAALQEVPLFFFLGANDDNDAVSYRDSFSAADEKLIMSRFGKTPVERWDAARRLYAKARMRATFKLYPGAGHEQTAEMNADIETFFREALK
jgi:dienelactone hydrolase